MYIPTQTEHVLVQYRITKTHTSVKVQFSHLQSVGLTFFLAEAENDDRLEVPLHDHLHYLEHTGRTYRNDEC